MTRPSSRLGRGGMTLIEMLVALTATLLMMTAIAQTFSVFGNAISGSRAVLEMDSRLRSVAWRLRSDLAGATARTLPPLGLDNGEGYFEVIEGPATDATDASGASTLGQTVSGDFDDALLLTTRVTDTPFIGRAPTLEGVTVTGQTDLFESTLAEVAWFARPTPGANNPVTYTLYRKQLLIMGYVGADPFYSNPVDSLANNRLQVPLSKSGTTFVSGTTPWRDYYNLPCDVSARLEMNTSGLFLYPNTLADLTRRECRFMHNVTGTTGTAAFPSAFVNHLAVSPQPGLFFDGTSQRQGEDVVITNVLSFDVRVFDPRAPVYVTSGSTALVPGDPGPLPSTPAALGAYVDLGNGISTATLLSGSGQARSGLAGSPAARRTYDTWSLHYEANGVDEDYEDINNNGILDPGEDKNANGVLDVTADQGTDGLDNDNDGYFDEPAYDSDGDGVFDDLGESETLPPYPVPLRGIEVRIRCYEPSSRQVRQVTIRHTFVPH